jgi:hypothetical protein
MLSEKHIIIILHSSTFLTANFGIYFEYCNRPSFRKRDLLYWEASKNNLIPLRISNKKPFFTANFGIYFEYCNRPSLRKRNFLYWKASKNNLIPLRIRNKKTTYNSNWTNMTWCVPIPDIA